MLSLNIAIWVALNFYMKIGGRVWCNSKPFYFGSNGGNEKKRFNFSEANASHTTRVTFITLRTLEKISTTRKDYEAHRETGRLLRVV